MIKKVESIEVETLEMNVKDVCLLARQLAGSYEPESRKRVQAMIDLTEKMLLALIDETSKGADVIIEVPQ